MNQSILLNFALGRHTQLQPMVYIHTHKSVLSHVINGDGFHSKRVVESRFSLILSLSSGSFLHYLLSFPHSLMWHLSGHGLWRLQYLRSVCVPSCQNTLALTNSGIGTPLTTLRASQSELKGRL